MPGIKELASRKNGRYAYILDAEGLEWGVAEGRVHGWIASHPEDTPEDLAEFFRESMESPSECAVVFHCFSLDPLRLAILVADEGSGISQNWWM